MSDNRYLRIYDLKQRIQHHPEIGTYVSEEDIDLMKRTIIDESQTKLGMWRVLDRTEYGLEAKCSECGYEMIFSRCQIGRYCPACGARMDGGNK